VLDLPYDPAASRVLLLDESGSVTASRAVGGALPSLTLDVREQADSVLWVDWTATGGGPDVDFRLEYAANGDGAWRPLTPSIASAPTRISRTALERGERPTIRLIASNGAGWVAEERRLDLTDMQIVRRWPVPGAQDPDGAVGITLNGALDPGALGAGLLHVRGDDGSDVPGRLAWDEGTLTLWFEPHAPLPPGRRWTVTVAPSLRDRWGNRISGESTWSFRSAPDVEPPRVVDSRPFDGDLTLPPSTRPVVLFDEPLGGDLTAALRLEQLDGTPVAGTTRWAPEPRALIFLPEQPLALRTTYRLIVSPSVADEAGNSIGDLPPITFTTAGLIQPGGGR
jgi:hypothetical protein